VGGGLPNKGDPCSSHAEFLRKQNWANTTKAFAKTDGTTTMKNDQKIFNTDDEQMLREKEEGRYKNKVFLVLCRDDQFLSQRLKGLNIWV
jgi:hypothetical protein